ncbi:MAG: M15 family metallopeptidase [Spirochaetia bacterium]
MPRGRFGSVWICVTLSLFTGIAGTAAAQGVDLFPAPGPQSTGEGEIKALAEAYSDRISSAASRDGDWALQLDREWFFWSHGRLLPQAERGDWEKYAGYRFYRYSLGELPPLPNLDAESAARLKKTLETSRAHPPRRSEVFLERLFMARSRAETLKRIVRVDFLGFSVQVHERIAGALHDVAVDCEALRSSDPQTADFLAGLAEIDGFNYRDVAGTFSRSYHSYGLAVDLIPKSYAGKAPYWRWVMDGDDRWWATPYERRWSVPQPVVAAFERHGFVWGGKWLFFDTMHFEYRPEILLLAGEGIETITPRLDNGPVMEGHE